MEKDMSYLKASFAGEHSHKASFGGGHQYGNYDSQSKQEKGYLFHYFPKVKGYFICHCSICNTQSRKNYPCPDRKHFFSRTGEYKARLKKGEYERKNYVWLLDQLCSPTEKIRGCHVNVCETVGFENGKPVHIIKMDKDNCVYKITSPVKLNLRQIMKDFKSPACLVSEQKKEFFDTNTISGSIIPVFPEPLKGKARVGTADSGIEIVRGKEKAILRHSDEKTVRMLSDQEFRQLMMSRPGSGMWKTLSCIQQCLKARDGISTPVYVSFTPLLHPKDVTKPLDFKYKHIKANKQYKNRFYHSLKKIDQSSDEDDGEVESDLYMQCHKLCYKIAYYVSKVNHYEILGMKAEFMRDDNGDIWFVYAYDIDIRELKGALRQDYIEYRIDLMNENARDNLVKELEEHEEKVKGSENKNIDNLKKRMKKHYKHIKKEIGIHEELETTPPDPVSNEYFLQLRPHSPYNYHDLQSQYFNKKHRTRESEMENLRGTNLSNSEIAKGILENVPLFENKKHRLGRGEYSNLTEQVRLVHNMIEDEDAQKEREKKFRTIQSKPLPHSYLKFSRPGTTSLSNMSKSKAIRILRKNIEEGDLFESRHQMKKIPSSYLHKLYTPPINKKIIQTNNPFYNQNAFSAANLPQTTKASAAFQKGRNQFPLRNNITLGEKLNYAKKIKNKKLQNIIAKRMQYLNFVSQSKGTSLHNLFKYERKTTQIDEFSNMISP